jgi:serine/threonine protein kinase
MSTDLFAKHFHEEVAIKKIRQSLDPLISKNLLQVYANVDILDPSTQTYYECDLIMVSRNFISIVELKNWSGEIRVCEGLWQASGGERRNPHRTNSQKCRILKSTLRSNLPSLVLPWIQSVVLLTNEEASVSFDKRCIAQNGRADRGNTCFTYDNIQTFVNRYVQEHLKRNDPRETLSESQYSHVKYFIQKLEQEPKQFRNQIPGFQIVKANTETELYAEYLAVPESPIDNKLKRLRVFGAIKENPAEQEKQLRGLNVLQRLPVHPNIPKVSIHPNPKNLLVEYTEWSSMGTVRDLLNKGPIEVSLAEQFAEQMLQALILLDKECIVHRAIRPENILVSEQTFQLINFDLAFDPASSITVMSEDDVNAISPYRAPEIIDRHPECKSDIFSLGVVLYELLTGSVPIKSCYDLKNTGGHLPPDLVDILKNASGSPRLVELINNCIQISVDSRPTAQEAFRYLKGSKELNQLLVSNSNDELVPGSECNVWRILNRISDGASAAVYKVIRGGDDGEIVAMKVLKVGQAPDRLRRERDFLRRIHSPYVVRCGSDFAWANGRPCLEMEFLEGETLRELIDNNSLPTDEQFQLAATSLLQGLIQIHQEDPGISEENRRPITHNDLNPSNIILTSRGPKIVDFGVASEPGLGPYCGTPAYIAPDAVTDGELLRSPSADRFSLCLTLCEWLSGVHPFKGRALEQTAFNVENINNQSLAAWFAKALDPDPENRFRSSSEMLKALENCFTHFPPAEKADIEPSAVPILGSSRIMALVTSHELEEETEEPNLARDGSDICASARLVEYINGLHNANAANQFALAESQALSAYFGKIHVPNSLTDQLMEVIEGKDDALIVLTGHAGDGKSTIALDVFKRLHGMQPGEVLQMPLKEIEELEFSGKTIRIVKDMSEWTPGKRIEKLKEAITQPGTWLIIANTGPLLTAYCEVVGMLRKDSASSIESEILQVLSMPVVTGLTDEHRLNTFNKPAFIANLSLSDNVPFADEFIQRITAPVLWESCDHCPAKKTCPIINNVALLQNDTIRSKLLLLYRRLTGYGTRITARQMTAHIAFAITAGLKCSDIQSAPADDTNLLMANICSNSLFGFSGFTQRSDAQSLHVVRTLNNMEFGAKPFAKIDRLLQDGNHHGVIAPLTDSLKTVFGSMLESATSVPYEQMSRFRQQIRRYVYLFCNLPKEDGVVFTDLFLKSPRLRDLEHWVTDGMKVRDRQELAAQTLSVLLDEFTGFKSSQYSRINTLYITVKREATQISQNVQLVLASFPFENFEIVQSPQKRQLALKHKFMADCDALQLSLPLLDFIALRYSGEVGEKLDQVYLNRLKLFKSKLLAWARGNEPDAKERSLRLLEVATDGSVRKCELTIAGGRIDAQYQN